MSIIKKILRGSRSAPTAIPIPHDVDRSKSPIVEKVRPYTMTSVERIFHLIAAVEYVVANGMPGSIVECGVWKGGSMMAVALTLLQLGDTSRDLYLYDTFEGMSAPAAMDVRYDDTPAQDILAGREKTTDNNWGYSPLDDVRRNLLSTSYPQDRIHFIKGKVEDTLPKHVPETIALLRLDTDWYESTLQELMHLYPRLVAGGPFIIDDYGWWKGARKAVDEYLATLNAKPLLHRIDDSARAGIKV
jgi:O-methyltransferase